MFEETIALTYEKEIASPFTDSLTGLFNHGFFQIYLEKELHRCQRTGQPFTLCVVDIDGFNFFNSRHGVVKGDLALKEVAHVIAGNIRVMDIAARYSGDQFAIILVGADKENATKIAERIRALIESTSDNRLTVSVGLSSSTPFHNVEKDKLIKEAVLALEQAKIRGKNRVFWFHPEDGKVEIKESRILVVDDEPLNLKLMEAILKPLGYQTYQVKDSAQALYILEKTDIDLVLLDIMMPGMDGFEVCRYIKSNDETRMIPVILITSAADIETKIKGIEVGADDFIPKPPNKPELLARVNSLLRLKKIHNNLASIENVLFSMANTVEAKDRYTQGHVDRVSQLALAIGQRFSLSERESKALRFGGALHDIGKLGVPEDIINKAGPLNEQEWSIMKKHPEIGYRICLPLKKNLGEALDIIRHHHEKLDGTGYPDGLKGDDIPLVARIMAVADIYDALVTDRPYRKAMTKSQAVSILKEDAAKGKLDVDVIESLVDIILK
jgi:putative two-component system response regulator